ncbi:YbaN family protein [Anaeropeptidivorans aminofermentans]|uniref:YbaN family protein n=1 Tax=Anaeropeptidivorans aminofermentans TaxID=2934315 RepID=UPI0020242A11|nr:YbaN family protein [Anaeropeptidivorans aminofermentans]
MGIKNILLCGVGFLLLGMGAIGLVLPLWPTTPFVLAAAGCFASTPRIYEKVIKIPFFNEYIRNYKDRKGLKPETVIISLTSLWGMLLLSAFHIQKSWVLIILAVVGISVTTHILWIAKVRNK